MHKNHGKSILIVTVATGNPPNTQLSDIARKTHQFWGITKNPSFTRRLEDKNACNFLNVDFLHLGIQDCIYRRNSANGKFIYQSQEAIFNRYQPLENNLINTVISLFKKLPKFRHVFSPLAVGNHVDHQITRNAAENVFGSSLFYYEDYPYALKLGSLKDFLDDIDNWTFEIIYLTAAEIKRKIKAISMYESQIPTIFGDFKNISKDILRNFKLHNGERIWKKKKKYN